MGWYILNKATPVKFHSYVSQHLNAVVTSSV